MSELVTRPLKQLPNLLTLSRAILAIAVFIAALHHKWTIGFWLLCIALSTDFLDGLAAKKLNAASKFGEEFDALTDSLVVTLGLLSLSLTKHLSWRVTLICFIIEALIGSDRVFNQPVWKWRTMVAVTSLFLAWTLIIWFYADLAFKWSWLYIPLTGGVLVMCGLLKRHRIKLWLNR